MAFIRRYKKATPSTLYKENIDCHYTYNKLVNTRVQVGIKTDKDLNKKDITYTDIQIHRGYNIGGEINYYKAKVNLYLK